MRYVILLMLLLPPPGWAGETIRVAVAANFRHTLEAINAGFEAHSGHRVLVSSASTGVLYSQIVYGAPFDVFFAADTTTPAKLTSPARTPFCYARGRLVLVGASRGLQQLADPSLDLAIANPATAPYGQAAMDVLSRAEFAAAKGRKVVRGASVVQAYQFWHSGGIDLALLPWSLAPQALLIPASWHRSLEQHAIALNASSPVNAYLNWVRSDTVRTQISNAGYEPCP